MQNRDVLVALVVMRIGAPALHSSCGLAVPSLTRSDRKYRELRMRNVLMKVIISIVSERSLFILGDGAHLMLVGTIELMTYSSE